MKKYLVFLLCLLFSAFVVSCGNPHSNESGSVNPAGRQGQVDNVESADGKGVKTPGTSAGNSDTFGVDATPSAGDGTVKMFTNPTKQGDKFFWGSEKHETNVTNFELIIKRVSGGETLKVSVPVVSAGEDEEEDDVIKSKARQIGTYEKDGTTFNLYVLVYVDVARCRLGHPDLKIMFFRTADADDDAKYTTLREFQQESLLDSARSHQRNLQGPLTIWDCFELNY